MGFGWFPDRAKLIEQFAGITADGKDDKATGILTLAVGGSVVEFLAYIDAEDKGKAHFAEHRKRVGFPIKDSMRGMDYHKEIQKMVRSVRGNYYVKGKLVESMTPELAKAIATIVAKEEKPSRGCKCQVRVIAIGGKAAIQGHDCYAFRNGKYLIVIEAQWTGKEFSKIYVDRRSKCTAWVGKAMSMLNALSSFGRKKSGSTLAAQAVGSVSIAKAGDMEGGEGEKEEEGLPGGKMASETKEELHKEEHDDSKHIGAESGNLRVALGIRNVYGNKLPRLQNLKARYDPGNIFRYNDNIVPAPEE
mmetsp:Transcript_8524/g.11728  ORF Transcript_8524/g.11728 Transcript_8524/m.11728 type:complete len:304 (+) Transcript_8524:101-1012(+)